MWIRALRNNLWYFVRWNVQHKAYWSTCNATVLIAAAKKCAEGHRVLGYTVSDPPVNHDENFYKGWITKVTNETLTALDWYHFVDGSISKAIPLFEQAAALIKPCAANVADLGETDEPLIQPAAAT